MSSGRRCSGRRADGKACKGWALRDSHPPLCYAHSRDRGEQEDQDSKQVDLGFYGRCYTLEEVADMVGLAMDDTLDDELAATRIAVRRVMQQLKKELTADEYAHMASLIFRGTNTVARLLRIKRSLAKEMDSDFETGIGEALDGVGEDLGLDL
jgi:hypothetical protein